MHLYALVLLYGFDKPSFHAQNFVRRYGNFKQTLFDNFTVPTAVQIKFVAIICLFTSYHCVGA